MAGLASSPIQQTISEVFEARVNASPRRVTPACADRVRAVTMPCRRCACQAEGREIAAISASPDTRVGSGEGQAEGREHLSSQVHRHCTGSTISESRLHVLTRRRTVISRASEPFPLEFSEWSGRRGSNPRPSAWEDYAADFRLAQIPVKRFWPVFALCFQRPRPFAYNAKG
jgi:hypothetical protein